MNLRQLAGRDGLGVAFLAGLAIFTVVAGQPIVAGIFTLILVYQLRALLTTPGPAELRPKVRPTFVFGSAAIVAVLAATSGRIEITVAVVVAIAAGFGTAWWESRGLVLTVAAPATATARESFPIRVRVDGLSGAAVVASPTGTTAIVTPDAPEVLLVTEVPQRGLYEKLPVVVQLSGWTGLFLAHKVCIVPLGEILAAVPQAMPVAVADPSEIATTEPGDGRLLRAGSDSVVRSVRPYVHGDSPRRVHWPSTARSGELTVRELDEPVTTVVRLTVGLGAIDQYADVGETFRVADLVTGQARTTVETWWQQGHAVELVTHEFAEVVDAAGRRNRVALPVTARVTDGADLGARLARAGWSTTVTSVEGYRIGPTPGPARPATEPPPLASDQDSGPDTDAAPAASTLDPTIPRWIAWLGLLAAYLVTGVRGDAGPGDGLLAAALVLLPVLISVGAGLYVWRDGLDRFRVMALVAAPALAVVALARDGGVTSSVIGFGLVLFVTRSMAPVAQIPRLVHDSSEGFVRWDVVGFAGALLGAAMLTVGWIGSLALATVAALAATALRARGRPSDLWTVVGIVLGPIAWAASALVPAPAWLMALTVLAGLALLVTASAPDWSRAANERVVEPRNVIRTAVLALVVLLILPFVAGAANTIRDLLDSPPSGGSFGEGLDQDTIEALVGSERMDTTRRPGGSNTPILRVTADRPGFWRGLTFDTWDGQAWTRDPLGVDPTRAAATDLAPGIRSAEVDQTFEVLGNFVGFVLANPEATRLEVRSSTVPAFDVMGRPLDPGAALDSTFSPILFDALFRGEGWTVTSQVPLVTAADLRASSDRAVPQDILDVFAAPPEVSSRTAAAVEAAVAGTTNTHDQVLALEAWLAGQVEYSLDAPVSVPGDDVVDTFLFETRAGWCQQIATALAIGLRHLGTPARVATGFVPGRRDALTGSWTLRERDYHAWVEVYHPGIGWQGYDPTASVPLAGETSPNAGVSWMLVLVVLATGLVVALLAWLVSRVRRRQTKKRERAARSWAVAADERLLALGEAAERPRRAGEGAAAHAAALAVRLDHRELVAVGRAIEADVYGPVPLAVAEQQALTQVLGQAEAIDVDVTSGLFTAT